VRTLGRWLASGLLAKDTATIDTEQMIIAAIEKYAQALENEIGEQYTRQGEPAHSPRPVRRAGTKPSEPRTRAHVVTN
jgi:hypothetical protein